MTANPFAPPCEVWSFIMPLHLLHLLDEIVGESHACERAERGEAGVALEQDQIDAETRQPLSLCEKVLLAVDVIPAPGATRSGTGRFSRKTSRALCVLHFITQASIPRSRTVSTARGSGYRWKAPISTGGLLSTPRSSGLQLMVPSALGE